MTVLSNNTLHCETDAGISMSLHCLDSMMIKVMMKMTMMTMPLSQCPCCIFSSRLLDEIRRRIRCVLVVLREAALIGTMLAYDVVGC